MIEDIKELTISKTNEHFIKEMINKIEEYFSTNEFDNEESVNKELEIKTIIEEIVYKDLDKNPIMKELNRLHRNEEGGGFSGIIGYDIIDNNKYRVFVEFEEGREEKVINATLEYLVDINKKNSIFNSYVINNNTFDDLDV